MALTNWNDILNKPKGIDEVPEIALTVEQLSASVLSLEEDVAEIALDISQLSASIIPYNSDDTIKEKIDNNDVKRIRLTQADFTWSSDDYMFVSNQTLNTILEGKIYLGLTGFINQPAYNFVWRVTSSDYLHITGWRQDGQRISSTTTFEIIIICK